MNLGQLVVELFVFNVSGDHDGVSVRTRPGMFHNRHFINTDLEFV